MLFCKQADVALISHQHDKYLPAEFFHLYRQPPERRLRMFMRLALQVWLCKFAGLVSSCLQPNNILMWNTYIVVRKNTVLSKLIILSRYLIGFAFMPSGYKKVIGDRFTQLPVSNPIGFFFEGLYQSGMYWQFLGLVQMLTALLLMTQRFATLGNLLFLGIASNICVITFSLHFNGTWVITSLMVLASVCLLLWDAPKVFPLLMPDNGVPFIPPLALPSYNRTWVLGGVVVFALSLMVSVCSTVKGLLPTVPWLVLCLVITVVLTFVVNERTERLRQHNGII